MSTVATPSTAVDANALDDYTSDARKEWWIAGWVFPLPLFPIWVNLTPEMPAAFAGLSGLVMFGVLLFSSITDVHRHRVLNAMTYPGFAWMMLLTIGVSFGLIQPEVAGGIGFVDAIAGAGACFGLMFLVFFFAGAGAGDVKLAAIIGAGFGVSKGIDVLFLTHLIAGGWILLCVIYRAGIGRFFAFAVMWPLSKIFASRIEEPAPIKLDLSSPVPMAIFFLLAAIATAYGV